ncbi:uncharacterized protein LOC127246019 [Andrographis paniculata]|uniref:uncharacterized protein LOC127246019 n=1 Tax=Andrographis paniculata TaxID=175694 RepID=UPI0021E89113|nr:uncharacterized protein LOC127246019 [Andrographis paniculata]
MSFVPYVTYSNIFSVRVCFKEGETNGVPPWELDYCHSVRVSWRKVLASKKSFHCHPNVLSWDDSAGKEALQNAKQQYWATINGLYCNNPLSNPDTYIDEIDWNSYVDPELMEDLDLQAFNLDDVQESDKLETINEEDGDNSCERPLMQHTDEHSKNDGQQGWGKWEDSANTTNENPWEQRYSSNARQSGKESWGNTSWEKCRSQADDPWKGDAWRSENRSSGWPQGFSTRGEGWGGELRNSNNNSNNDSWGWNGGGGEYSGGMRGWRDNRDSYRGRNDCAIQSSYGWRGRALGEYVGDTQGFERGGRSSSRGYGYRKRESSIQHTSRFKSSRHQGRNSGNWL